MTDERTDESEAERLFRKAGGRPRFREITKLPKTRVDSIARTGRVPHALRKPIFLALVDAGIPITPYDFVPELVGLVRDGDATLQPAG